MVTFTERTSPLRGGDVISEKSSNCANVSGSLEDALSDTCVAHKCTTCLYLKVIGFSMN